MASSGCIIRVIAALLLPALVLCQIQSYEGYKEEFRLPGDVYPTQQWVTIYTKLIVDDFCFWGYTEIKLVVIAETSQIVLHSCALNVNTDTITVRYADSNEQLALGQPEFNTDFEFLIINLQQPLAVNAEVIVYIEFDAPLLDAAYGYFRTSYEDLQGNTIWFSATFFEAGKARMAFPCLDEPGYKAIFSITLVHSPDFIPISNMDIKEQNEIQEEGLQGWFKTVFNDTPNLSTYLVAMMLCQFQYIEIPNMSVPTRVWGRSDVINQLTIVERTVERVFPAFVNMFKVELKLSKLDVIAVPKYMFDQESWGCLMIDEARVLYNQDFHTIYDPTLISADISHLIAHLWCGDLVTMNWWSNMFLADGLAFYYQEVGVAIFFDMPHYQDIRFCSIHRIEMNDDSSVDDSQAIVAPIDKPTNLFQHLTDLFYRKSYFYTRQLMMIISPDAFLNGLINYFNDFQYSSAKLSDFLEELNKAGKAAQTITDDFDLNITMERWSYGKGYPLLKVEIDYQNQIAYLSQIRFIYETRLGYDDRAQLEAECWPIPLSWVFSANLDFSKFMVQDWLLCNNYVEVFLENFSEQDFLLFNVRLYGIYRVTYSDTVWIAIANFLRNENEFSKIDTLNRMQILSDSLEVAWPGYLSYSIAFKILPYLAFETEEPPLRTALYSLRDIRDRLQRTDLLPNYCLFVREFLEPLFRRYNDISLVPDSITEARFKLFVDSWAGTYQVAPCLEQSYNLLIQWYNTDNPDANNPININVRETAYCYGIQQSNVDVWNWMLQRFYFASDDDEKSRILFGLGCTTDPQILADFLSWTLDPTIIDSAWFTTVFLSVYYNEQPTNFTVLYNFLTNNFQAIIQVLEEDMGTVCALLGYIGTIIEKGDELDQFQAFLNSVSVESCQSDIDEAIRDALNNISWHQLHDSELYDLLSPLAADNTQTGTVPTETVPTETVPTGTGQI